MEIAEYLQQEWYSCSDSKDKSKVFGYISKIKREKKFDGSNIAKLNDRYLSILAKKYLGLNKGDTDYQMFIAKMHELQCKYSKKSSEKRKLLQRRHTLTPKRRQKQKKEAINAKKVKKLL